LVLPYLTCPSFHHIWTDPWPYNHVEDDPLNQNCPGLDTSLPLGYEVKLLFAVLGSILFIGIGVTGYAIIKFTKDDHDGYEPIE
jgi:hypothetical protein